MHRLITTTITLALVTGMVASPALAKGHSFKLHRDATINGSQLKGQKPTGWNSTATMRPSSTATRSW